MKIKKILPSMAFLMLFSTPAIAEHPKYYFGLEQQFTDLSFKESLADTSGISPDDYYESRSSAIVPVFGYQFAHNHAIEFSFSSSQKSKTNTEPSLYLPNKKGLAVESEVAHKMLTSDYVYSYQVGNSPINILVLGGASIIDVQITEFYQKGIKYIRTDDTPDGELGKPYMSGATRKSHQLGYGLNAGIGLELEIQTQISIVAKAKYSKVMGMDFKNTLVSKGLDSVKLLTVGMRLKF